MWVLVCVLVVTSRTSLGSSLVQIDRTRVGLQLPKQGKTKNLQGAAAHVSARFSHRPMTRNFLRFGGLAALARVDVQPAYATTHAS